VKDENGRIWDLGKEKYEGEEVRNQRRKTMNTEGKLQNKDVKTEE
jgi:hypothetical protein